MNNKAFAVIFCALGISAYAQDFSANFFGRMASQTFDPVFGGPANLSGNASTGSFEVNANHDPGEFRSYYVFDLSAVSFGPVVSATLDMKGGSWGDQPGTSETVELWDVNSSDADLNSSWNSTVFADLGSGLSYGQSTISKPANFDERKLMTLDADGIAAINAAIGTGKFKMGMSLVTMGPPSDFVFANGIYVAGAVRLDLTDGIGNTLLLTVPEPSTYTAVFAAGLVAFAAVRKRIFP
jgi:hypothetical protein